MDAVVTSVKASSFPTNPFDRAAISNSRGADRPRSALLDRCGARPWGTALRRSEVEPLDKRKRRAPQQLVLGSRSSHDRGNKVLFGGDEVVAYADARRGRLTRNLSNGLTSAQEDIHGSVAGPNHSRAGTGTVASDAALSAVSSSSRFSTVPWVDRPEHPDGHQLKSMRKSRTGRGDGGSGLPG